MVSDFSITLSKFSRFSSSFPFPTAIRQAEKEGQPHIIAYVPDAVYDLDTYRSVVPQTFEGYPVGVEPQRNGINLLMAMWKYVVDEK